MFEVKRMKSNEIKNLVAMGIAKDITYESAEYFESHNFDVLNTATGTYGAAGAVLRDKDSGEICAIVNCSTNLFRVI